MINGLWAALLLRRGRAWRSPALQADGKHLLTDVVTSVGVLIGVALAAVTGYERLDAILAALVALNVLWSGWDLVQDSVGGLMDTGAPDETVGRLREIIGDHAQGALEAHDLRNRQASHTTFVEFHLVAPGEMGVAQAHAICDRTEEAIRAEVEGAVVTIHVEPDGKAKRSGVPVL